MKYEHNQSAILFFFSPMQICLRSRLRTFKSAMREFRWDLPSTIFCFTRRGEFCYAIISSFNNDQQKISMWNFLDVMLPVMDNSKLRTNYSYLGKWYDIAYFRHSFAVLETSLR